MNVCTVIAKNYLAQARVLARSFAEFHPDGTFTTLILDDYEGFIDPADEPFDVISPHEIDLPELPQMASSYDVLELSTAVKPWLLRTLLKDRDHVVYLDPDIQIFSPCDEVADLAREHGIVLTPHNVAAMPRDGLKPSETDILVAGAYNLGFLALAERPDTHEFLDWWSERLLIDCIVDIGRGYFVDQRWIDLVPGMVPSVHFLRDPGCNVAYWNLATRAIERTAEGGYTVNGGPLRFFHFSGYDPERPGELSKHQTRIDVAALPVVRELCEAYGAALTREGHGTARHWPYGYALTAGGRRIDRDMRRLFVDGQSSGDLHGSFYDAAGEAEFVAYARGPAGGAHLAPLSRFLHQVWRNRDDLQSAFGLHDLASVLGLQRWAREYGATELGASADLLNDAEQPGAAESHLSRTLATGHRRRQGVNVVGYLRSELGVGEVARQVIGALDAVDVPVMPSWLVATASRQGHDYASGSGLAAPFQTTILCVNADQTPSFAAEAGPAFFADRHTIGWWWWEVSAFPEGMRGALGHVDELWAGSHFVADTLRAVSGEVPVHRIPMPVHLPDAIAPARERLGLPDGFIFLFVYDYNSVLERKNPLGLIDAFARAFPQAGEVSLVLKSINSENHVAAHEAVARAAAGHPGIVVMDDYVSASDKDRLIASCDCYVSLHRSEGFGITMAEAMLLGKPVVATGYSGNLDFMTEENSYPVRHALVPIGPGNSPYPPDGEWAQPDLDHAAALMRSVVEDPGEAARRAAAGRRFILEHHSPQVAGAAMSERLAGSWLPPQEADLDGTRARQATLDAILAGPPGSARPKLHPGRVMRAAMLRATRPLVAHERRKHEAILWSLEQSVRAEQERAETQQAALLTHLRAVERRLESLERAAADESDDG